jgi:hypothetical protein
LSQTSPIIIRTVSRTEEIVTPAEPSYNVFGDIIETITIDEEVQEDNPIYEAIKEAVRKLVDLKYGIK